MTAPTVDRAPRATVRVQLNAGCGFAEAARAVPYFAALGISHLYASPIFRAQPGSTHGYDVVDFAEISPELGGAAAFEAMVAALRRHAMGLILDIVPNHMGVGGTDNRWWLDVLSWGERSPYARYFDIDWRPLQPELHGRLLVPMLGDHYGAVLERGEIRVRFDAGEGSFSAWYYDHRFPLCVAEEGRLLAAAAERMTEDGDETAGRALAHLADELAGLATVRRDAAPPREAVAAARAGLRRLAEGDAAVRTAIASVLAPLGGDEGAPANPVALDALLERQHWRLAHWMAAADEGNYRRFFDITGLAALRIDRDRVFDAVHALPLRLVAEGKVQGLRIDHIDGLADPGAYCRRLQRAAARQRPAAAADGGDGTPRLAQPLYLVVEKVLAAHEALPEDWPVAGTTGYDFMNLVLGLFVDRRAEPAMTRAYARYTGEPIDFQAVLDAAKREVLSGSFPGGLEALGVRAHRLARQGWRTRDLTRRALRDGLGAILRGLRVYRPYLGRRGMAAESRREIADAVTYARRTTKVPAIVLDFLADALTGDLAARQPEGYRPADVRWLAMRFQQRGGPLMAKAMEDTALYRHVRLACLNEVGGDPERFGVAPGEFHRAIAARAGQHPFAMVATATHDHKRGEDARLRIAALTECTAEWSRLCRSWARLTAPFTTQAGRRRLPDRRDAYLALQTLVAMWPADLGDEPERLAALADRLVAYLVKAAREAKLRTGWTAPDTAYEEALERHVRGILDPRRGAECREALRAFLPPVLRTAAVHGLAQTALRLTVPGVPDLYQGTERWDLSLVDPDNRGHVDFAALAGGLEEARRRPYRTLLADWRSGLVKQRLVADLLGLRARQPALLLAGGYRPLSLEGPAADRFIAFERAKDGRHLLVLVPRLAMALLAPESDAPVLAPDRLGDTAAVVPSGLPALWRDVLAPDRTATADGRRLRLAPLLDGLPLACLVGA